MKKIITLVLMLFSTATMLAQAPQKMSYQAVIRNASNALIANSNIRMRISVLHGTATGTAVYVETQAATTNANGLATLEIGAGTVVSGTFASIAWGTNAYFIKTETDPTGGTNYTIIGTSQFLSVPYALFAASGTPGPQGPQGLPGTNGTVGAQGPIGLTGATGPQGLPGTNGTNGAVGATGPQGLQGNPGAANISGTTNRLVKFTGAATGGDSQISDDGANVKIQPAGYTGFTANNSKVEIAGTASTLRLVNAASPNGEFARLNFGDAERVYINEDADDKLQLYATGRTAITGGNVGIGTLSPAETLDVAGKTKTTELQVSLGAGLGKVLTSDTSGNASWQAPDPAPANYWTASGTNIYSNNTGNVGIGIFPSEKLDVAGKTKTTTFQMTSGAGTGKVITSDAAGNAGWSDPTAVNQQYEKFCPTFSTTTQGSFADLPATNITVAVSGTYLITYFFSANNNWSLNCIACTEPKIFSTSMNLVNKTTGIFYQTQVFDFLDIDTNDSHSTYVLRPHDVSGCVVKTLTAGQLVGFKVDSVVSGSGPTATISGNSAITMVRLY